MSNNFHRHGATETLRHREYFFCKAFFDLGASVSRWPVAVYGAST
jgi:hypothetical protein